MTQISEKERKRRQQFLQEIKNKKIKLYIASVFGDKKPLYFNAAFYALKKWEDHTENREDSLSIITISDIDSYIKGFSPTDEYKRTVKGYLGYLENYFEHHNETILAEYCKERKNRIKYEKNPPINAKDIQNLYLNGKPKIQVMMQLLLKYKYQVDDLETILFENNQCYICENNNEKRILPINNETIAIAKRIKRRKGDLRLIGSRRAMADYLKENIKNYYNKKLKLSIPAIRMVDIKKFSERHEDEIDKVLGQKDQ